MRFYKETNFKDTEIGRIPKEWEVVKLGDIANIKRGASPRPKGDPKYFGGDTPWIKISDLSKYKKGVYLLATDDTVTEEGRKRSVYVKDGSLIISNSGTIGEPAIVRTGCGGCIHDGLILLTPLIKVEKLFLYYFFEHKKGEFQIRAQKGTQGNMNTTLWKMVKLPLPPFEEQQKIAEILSMFDKAIQKTNEIIAKTERLKKGLKEELLTKGIGHKEFKDTEIGRIPKDWEVVRLNDRKLAVVIMGQSPPSRKYNKEGKGIPFLQGKMEFGDIYPLPIIYCSQPIKIAEQNDILISVRAPVGDVNIAPYRLCIGRGLASIRFNPETANYWFYFYYLQRIKSSLENLGKGSTFKAITKDDLENLKMVYPPLPEQQKIAKILSTIDKKLEIERKEKEKLERIKQGMMDLLLTGKIRVKVA
jgi:type I restriction enzyme S subunit